MKKRYEGIRTKKEKFNKNIQAYSFHRGNSLSKNIQKGD